MLEYLQAALEIVFSVQTIAALFGGVVIGTIIGAIPGMTVTMGVALTLPFTFAMHPAVGILLLLGVYKGGVYGGSITAILIKTPGTPAASCTVLDGYPMSQKGEARKALDMALYASCFADFISNISLILFAGLLASFALRFGPPEYFTLIVFSLTIIAGIAGQNMAKGMVSAGLGLLLATFGLDLVYGTKRFVFGEVELMAGLNFIPVLIGLFALPEIINYYARRFEERGQVQALSGGHATFAEFRRSFKSIFRGSVIGVVLGAIPGIGGAPSAFLSYSEAQRTSKHPETFGKGEIEGVAAAEAGNNGTCGATLIPLLALGVPGDIVTAVILGAFMIHGLQPGPLLFEDNLDLIYALFIGIMISSVFLFIVGKSAIRVFSRVVLLPNKILFPIVLVLCVYGCYAVNNNLFDVLVMMLIGLLGFAMLRANIPAAPFLIAYVLGPLLEDNFRQSLLLSHGGLEIFVRNEICWIFWALTALVLFVLIRRGMRARRAQWAEG
ncbi:MAG: tripartite tricarboxylate transporter permease [Alphaproteobacteria bacterium]|nr:tripartite tricarboxylate transporter permease [Alphaproteobacteria bacterium]